ncbi:DUF2855 family protein [Sinimarinibacterium thermocellulolyticum]|uniref:DUF2855 family protein n=1 Tax=Sinimarinibacterium thermocellulolyticum TaxID=3170016 RepID=A0ABV2A652_9GAMM
MNVHELWVRRDDLRQTRLVERAAQALDEGEIRVAIDKFGLTANNVSYALTGDLIGYWKFYPAQGHESDGWGKVPVWGFADVIESRCADIAVGERLWGFFPMATQVVLRPGKIEPARFKDFAPHRKALPGLYNEYHRTANDPPFLKQMEDERCLLFPLFATSFILYDYLIANDFFGAQQVLIGSASSKTGFGLAHLLHHDIAVKQRVVGLTSPSNVAFVKGLDVCDEVVTYGDIATLDASKTTAFIDMAGSGEVIRAVHEHFCDNIRHSAIVGATHWDAARHEGTVPGARPTMFFAPSHIARREKEWGPGAVLMKAFAAGAKIAQSVADKLEVVHARGPAAVEQRYLEMINNQVPPSRGLMLSMQG